MRYIKTAFFVLFPSLVCYIVLSINEMVGRYVYINNAIIFVPFYLATIVYIFVYIRKQFDKPAILPISLALTPSSVFIYEYLHPSWLQYVFTYLTALCYALPFTIITTITALVIAHKRRKNATQ